LSVDFNTKKLIYPSIINGYSRNTDFDAPENFVVFECVNRLLEKGYRPEHIELEKEWHLGHDAKSGRADICVSNTDGSMLFIIECKTAGREFDKAYKDTMSDGAQLFSYWQQERSTKWLILYASDFIEGEIQYKAPTINCTDDPNVCILAKKDSSIKLYKDAYTAIDKYKVWKETYSCTFHDNLIFSNDSVAYNVGLKPLFKKDLRDFAPEDKIVNKFEEILRHNNVSDKENAFNRLVALFICKLVDESTKGENDEVEFQYKQGTDTYETLQDRLQRLHKDGMEKFMREKIFYVPADYPEWLFSTYAGEERKYAIEDLKEKIRILKFYSNNDFTFKDVHNEELFYQNGKILVEVVQLFEHYRLVYKSKHQFLGDLFERLLSKGFKQNEGQFFTPTPITRFIWDSLPLKEKLGEGQSFTYPKVIDYACGAGHFLTEAVEAINFVANSSEDNGWVRDHIFGIEKDYRLARVSKISLFMNGAGEGNIIFGDGLENYVDKKIENNTFDILVANPPYSVSSFKQHLQIKNNHFELLDSITDNGGEIEVLFVERIAQLLKPKGIACVILPSSILTNNSESYVRAREQILRNFYLRAIVQFGSKTFGATGTNTTVLFLEKFNEPPKYAEMLMDSVNAILSTKSITNTNDKEILLNYLVSIGVEEEIFNKLKTGTLSLEESKEYEHFKVYADVFENSSEYKTLIKQKSFNKLSSEEQNNVITSKFINFIKEIEINKILYFAITYNQKTVLINAPQDNAKQKDFLGYDWSNRKGSEGIQQFNPGGWLYDDKNREANDTLASLIRSSFNETYETISEKNKVVASVVGLSDMLDFNKTIFDFVIKTTIDKKIEIKTKYELKPIGELVPTIESGSRPEGGVSHITDGVLSLGGEHIDNESGYLDLSTPKFVPQDFFDSSERGKLQKDDVLICKDGARTGKVAIVRNELDGKNAMLNEHVFLLRTGNEKFQKYLYEFLFSSIGQELLKSNITGAGQGGLNSTNLKLIKIPNPDEAAQDLLLKECKKVDEKFEQTRMSINEYKDKISKIFEDLDIASVGGGLQIISLKDLCISLSAGGDVPEGKWSKVKTEEYQIPIYSNGIGNNALYGYTNVPKVVNDSVTISARGTIGYCELRKGPFYPIVRLIVATPDETKVDKIFFEYLLKNSTFVSSGKTIPQLTVPFVEDKKFKIPNMNVQKEISTKIIEIENEISKLEEKLHALAKEKTNILNAILN